MLIVEETLLHNCHCSGHEAPWDEYIKNICILPRNDLELQFDMNSPEGITLTDFFIRFPAVQSSHAPSNKAKKVLVHLYCIYVHMSQGSQREDKKSYINHSPPVKPTAVWK